MRMATLLHRRRGIFLEIAFPNPAPRFRLYPSSLNSKSSFFQRPTRFPWSFSLPKRRKLPISRKIAWRDVQLGKEFQIADFKYVFWAAKALQFESILDCIDVSLDSLGQATKNMIYAKMQSQNHFARQDIIFKPEEFKMHLETMFETSSKLFERSIVRGLVMQFELNLQTNFDLVGAIHQAKEVLSRPHEEQLVVAWFCLESSCKHRQNSANERNEIISSFQFGRERSLDADLHIAEKYLHEVKRWFCISNLKLTGDVGMDLLVYDSRNRNFLPNGVRHKLRTSSEHESNHDLGW